ncbi:MAG: sulfite exporter TauE/SafE family protein [Verrucomicrobiota bacterium]
MLAPMDLTWGQWVLLALGAFVTGLSKTGIAGLGVLSVALFANALPARESTGALLPLLLCADLFGLAYFRKHASWGHLWKLFPWVIVGVLAGFLAVNQVSSAQMARLISVILLAMVTLHIWRRKNATQLDSQMPHAWWIGAITGVLAGFTTMTANAAGPIMMIYFLAIGLPKLTFIGTAAWFFMLVNAFKVPFSLKLGLITPASLLMDAALLLPMIPGALLGPVILKRLNQEAFEWMCLILTLLASLRLLF